MDVAVIGAGIGGLCAAIGLHRAGASVTIFERADRLRPGGFGLSLFANALRALDSLGVGDDLRSVTDNAASLLREGQRRPDGRWLATYPVGAIAELRIVERAALYDVLTAALGPVPVRTGHAVRAVHSDGTVEFGRPDKDKDLSRTHYDVVVVADGVHSTIRSTWPDDPGVRYAGYDAWRGVTSEPVDTGGAAGETWGDGRRFGIAPLPDGRVYWFASAATASVGPWLPEAPISSARALFRGWHEPIPQVLDATPIGGAQRLPVECLAGRLTSYRRGRMVLVGDAAHAMTPDLGQGGGQAMEDAATLSALLAPIARMPATMSDGIDVALAAYTQVRRRRTQTIAQRSLRVGRIAHVRGRVARPVRDALVRAVPDAALGYQLRQLQRWTEPTP